MIQMGMRVDMYPVFVSVAVYMNQIIIVKQLIIFKDFFSFTGFYYGFLMAENANHIRYFFSKMQVLSGNNDCFARSIGLN